MPTINLNRPLASWAEALSPKYRYIFVKGGRGSGKSHEIGGYITERTTIEPDLSVVCIREIQKSIQFSSKLLIEGKIREYNLQEYYEIIKTEIRSKIGSGIYIFQGMQDHTADSIKSLEGFKLAWYEEAQNMSFRSLKLLRPTIRAQGSQIIFTWNPETPEDPIEKFCNDMKDDPSALIIHVNYDQNPFLPDTLKEEMELDKRRYPEDFDHIWLGDYNFKKDERVFHHYSIEECEPSFDDDLYYGADWGFSQDPTTLLRAWIKEETRTIYVDHQVDGIGVEIDHTPALFDKVPESRLHFIRGDNARPEMISYLNRQGFKVKAVEKGKGSVEDGIEWLRSYNIVVHPRCELLHKELRLYSYQKNRNGDILPKVEDKNNHCIDALRYAFEPLIKAKSGGFLVI